MPTLDRRDFIRTAGLMGLGTLFTGMVAPGEAETKTPPNIVFIISDDLSTALSGYQHSQCHTPHLDRLAARGTLFERAYCQYPVCGPSRASLLCGHYPASLGTANNASSDFRDRFPDLITLPQFFRHQGYTTARVSKIYHMGVPGDILRGTPGTDDPLSWDVSYNIRGPEQYAAGRREDLSPSVSHQGMDFVKVEATGGDLAHADGLTVKKAIELLGHLKSPFFLAVGMVRPHVPLVAPASYFDPYPVQEMKRANVPAGDLQDVPIVAQSQTNEVKYGMNTEQQRKVRSAYYASISYMDAQVGKILDELKRRDLYKNTIIVFTSDHGYNLGEHTCWQKLSLWEDTVRVPLIVSHPFAHSRQGQRENSIIELVDLYPTLSELCGFVPPEGLAGKSFRSLLLYSTEGTWVPKSAYTITRHGGESLRTDRWRLNLWGDGEEGIELYDHNVDPDEYNNLAHDKDYHEIVKDLVERLRNRRDRAEMAAVRLQKIR
jgi:arylsulfatase A-like enzyme